MKKLISLTLTILLILSFTLTAQAKDDLNSKEEVVYGLLNTDGSTDKIYVVNIFKGGKITDYGNYTEVENLTSSEKINVNGDEISLETKAEKFYYQGTLKSKALPWNISIVYKLDGSEISAARLAGKSGALEIDINITQNPDITGSFYDDYALQLSLQLDTKLCSNIRAESATIANAGASKQLTYTILPGKGADIKITADVKDFEMKEISISGIKMLMDMDIDYSSFTGDLKQLIGAVGELDNGAAELLGGAKQLSAGMEAYLDGLDKYRAGLSAFKTGIEDLSDGTASLSNGLKELIKQNDAIIAGADAILKSAFDAANAQLQASGLKLPVLTQDNYTAILSNIPELNVLKTQLDGAVSFNAGLKAYTEGVKRIGAGAEGLYAGSAQLASSALTLTSSADDLYEAAKQINEGLAALRDGLSSYKAGTAEFKGKTSDIDRQLISKADELIGNIFGSGSSTVSFVSEKNERVDSVQFVMKTAPIEKPEPAKTPVQSAERLSFWQKLLRLFGIY